MSQKGTSEEASFTAMLVEEENDKGSSFVKFMEICAAEVKANSE